MAPGLILTCIGGYFVFLLLIASVTSRKATAFSYFLGNKQSPWYAVTFGMIGDSLSGVTFISVPGWVGRTQFSYLQMVLGYLVGYAVIAQILLPLYYRLQLTSIYSYLRGRFGLRSQRTGSFFFIVSRTIGAAFRLYLTASVVQAFVFDAWGIPFWLTVATINFLILLYTFKGGIRTLVWTDTFQSLFLLLGVFLSIWAISRQMNLALPEMISSIRQSPYAQIFFWDWQDPKFFGKQFLSGALIAIVMTGLDQNMMQKNLSCRSLGEAQKNIYVFTVILVVVNLLFLSMGALLHLFAQGQGIPLPAKSDQLFPLIALKYLGPFAATAFIIGLTAATFSSADSVLTTLTTSVCIDLLDFEEKTTLSDSQKTRIRQAIHLLFAFLLLFLILLFKAVNNDAVISALFTLAGYTYGPLLGLFAFGLFSRRRVYDRGVPLVCLAAPALSYLLNANSARWFGGYQFGFELIALNGLLTFAGLLLLSRRNQSEHAAAEETSVRPAVDISRHS